jgi:hypothetical protein
LNQSCSRMVSSAPPADGGANIAGADRMSRSQLTTQ